MRTIKVFVLLCLISLTAAARQVSAAEVKLLLVRSSELNTQCEDKVIQGRLFGVPSNIDLSSVESTVGLIFLARTEEPPLEGNRPNWSAIPPMLYQGYVRVDETKAWMKGRPDRAWRIELLGTEPRKRIQFHYGRDRSWSSGCIVLASASADSTPLMCNDADSPEAAVRAVREYYEASAGPASSKVTVRIVHWSTDR